MALSQLRCLLSVAIDSVVLFHGVRVFRHALAMFSMLALSGVVFVVPK